MTKLKDRAKFLSLAVLIAAISSGVHSSVDAEERRICSPLEIAIFFKAGDTKLTRPTARLIKKLAAQTKACDGQVSISVASDARMDTISSALLREGVFAEQIVQDWLPQSLEQRQARIHFEVLETPDTLAFREQNSANS